jgi:Ni,Fe-hydrogenase III large subunit
VSFLSDILASGKTAIHHRPWPRAVIDTENWTRAAAEMSEGRLTLLGLWGEPHHVHMAVRDEAANAYAVLSLPCPDGHFPSVARLHPPALRLERAVRDLFGLHPDGLPDTRPWLDHGKWGVRHPLGKHETGVAAEYPFLPVEGESLHTIPVGPVHAGIIEPGFFRFTANGETVVRLEERLGYVHKGIEGLLAGADLARGCQLAGRTSGDSTVAYALAFARASEAALAIDAPPRAHYLRALMAELERLANHFGDFGTICNDASFALMHAQCGILRERMLRASDACFGHRLMRDCVVVGGVAADLGEKGVAALRSLAAEAERRMRHLTELYDRTPSLLDRTVTTGVVKLELTRQYASGGYVGRASGRNFDARRNAAYAPYDALTFDVPVLQEGDVNARVWIRIKEIGQSLSLLRQILDRMPEGAIQAEMNPATGSACEGVALVEGFRGDILVWLRIDADGKIERCHLRDPSWFQWPLLEAAIEGNIVADFPLCNKSFNCSYSGHDL